MAIVEELLRTEENGAICFGNHTMDKKAKKEDSISGKTYKVKTFAEMTKLEKNEMFLYESVPGTSVNHFVETENGVEFTVEGAEDSQITLGMKEDTEYEVYVGGESIGKMSTGLGGKLILIVELAGAGEVAVKVTEA